MSEKAYLQFQLMEAPTKLVRAIPTKATRGDKEVVNLYCHWEYIGHAGFLAHFHPRLRPALLVKTENEDLDADHRPLVQFPEMGWIPWDWKSTGYGLVVPRGISSASHIKMNVDLIDTFRMKMFEGDRAGVRWRTRSDPADAERGIVTGMVGQSFPINLTPPGEDYVADEAPKRGKKKPAQAADDRQAELEGAPA
jgi:hypothetical protein